MAMLIVKHKGHTHMKDQIRKIKLFVLICMQITLFHQTSVYADGRSDLKVTKAIKVVKIERGNFKSKKSIEKRKIARVERKVILDFTKM